MLGTLVASSPSPPYRSPAATSSSLWSRKKTASRRAHFSSLLSDTSVRARCVRTWTKIVRKKMLDSTKAQCVACILNFYQFHDWSPSSIYILVQTFWELLISYHRNLSHHHLVLKWFSVESSSEWQVDVTKLFCFFFREHTQKKSSSNLNMVNVSAEVFLTARHVFCSI